MFVKRVLLVVLLAAVCFDLANAQVFYMGACPNNIQVISNFSVTKYLGLWYEFAKYPTLFEDDGKCNTAQYTLQSDGNVGVNNSMVNIRTGALKDIVGSAVAAENAKLKVSFPINKAINSTSNYWVLNTDYNSYSVVYSCQSFGALLHSTFVWILTRAREPSTDIVELAKGVLLQNGVSLEPLVPTLQSGCSKVLATNKFFHQYFDFVQQLNANE